jgi:hypothetical protein
MNIEVTDMEYQEGAHLEYDGLVHHRSPLQYPKYRGLGMQKSVY